MPVFKMLQSQQLSKNFNELAKNVLAKHNATDDIRKLPAHRLEQLELIEAVIDAHAPNRIITGAMLFVKAQIEAEYSQSWNPYKRYVASPDNSVLHAEIDKAIGVTEENLLDTESNAFLIEDFKTYQKELQAKGLYQQNIDTAKTFVKPEDYDNTVIKALQTNVKCVDKLDHGKANQVHATTHEKVMHNIKSLGFFKELKATLEEKESNPSNQASIKP
jgi:Substrate of the Dot/Icm secretion system, putative